MIPDQKGFTLIELLIVMSILAILCMTVFISYSKDLPKKHLKAAAAQLFMDLHEAKSKAVLNRQSYSIQFDSANQSYRLLDSDDNIIKSVSLAGFKSGIFYGQGPAIKTYTKSAFESDYITYSGDKATFNAQGTSSNGYVYLTNMNDSVCYVIGTPTYTGYIKMRKTESETWPVD